MSKKRKSEPPELKEFIQQTLIQIVSGVKTAKEGIEGIGGEICLTGLRFSTGQENPTLKAWLFWQLTDRSRNPSTVSKHSLFLM